MKIRWIREQLAGTPFLPTTLQPLAGGPTVQAAAPPVAAPPVAASAPAARATHLVLAGGMAAWPTPDGSRLPTTVLPGRLELVVEARSGPWAEVRAANGWRGWVDGRLLVDRL
jgi:hypothetical protein